MIRCVEENGEEAEACKKVADYYKSSCPEWVLFPCLDRFSSIVILPFRFSRHVSYNLSLQIGEWKIK